MAMTGHERAELAAWLVEVAHEIEGLSERLLGLSQSLDRRSTTDGSVGHGQGLA